MLRELAVQNLALIEDVRVELRPGFCAWTGETGAGKSLLLGALGLLLGERASTDLLRSGADELRVTGVFELTHPQIKQRIAALLDTDSLDDQLLLARRVHRSGRGGAYINDQPVAVATLRAVGSLLVDIHGQRESAALLDPAYQLDLLDAFGNLHKLRASYNEKAEQLRAARKRLAELSAAREQRLRELSLVRFEREELDKARLEPGEREELARECQRLSNAQALQAFAHQAYALLYEDEGSASERLGRVQRDAQAWAELDPELAETVSQLDSLLAQVKDVAQTLRRLGERWEADPERLAEVESRLQLLKKLESKYRKSIDELIVYRVTLDDREAHLQAAEDDLSSLESQIASLLDQTREAAKELSRQRHKVAKKLAAEVEKQLADLGMPEAKLGTELTTRDLTLDDIPAAGIDHLELTLAANAGEPPRPLRKVA
ncbi:MAG: DNA repair protein RecN, partial [Gemmataceae bacterium]